MSKRYENKSSITSQKMSVQTAFTEAKITNIQPKQCRICLQSELQSQRKDYMIACKCSGSVQWVHEYCIKSWMLETIKKKTRAQLVKIASEGFECELCKQKIKVQLQEKLYCCSCSQTKAIIELKKCYFIVNMLLISICFGGLIFSLYSIVANYQKIMIQTSRQFEIILAICGATTLGCLGGLGLYNLIKQFGLIPKFRLGKIKKVGPQLTAKKNSRSKVAPLQESIMQIQVSNLE